MTPTVKTFLKWLVFGIVLPLGFFLVLAAVVVATHKDTPEQLQVKRDHFIEDSIRHSTDSLAASMKINQ